MNKKTFNRERPLSWSAISCFDDETWGDKEKWYERYVLGLKEKPSRELLFGSKIDKLLQSDPTFLPELERFPYQQYKLEANYKGIPLIGFADDWDPYSDIKRLSDSKTGKNPWTQKKANETGQLTMYATMLYLNEGIKPEQIEFYIKWMQTVQHADLSIDFVKDMKVKTFKTKRKMSDVLKFMNRIEKVHEDMQKYAENHA